MAGGVKKDEEEGEAALHQLTLSSGGLQLIKLILQLIWESDEAPANTQILPFD